MIEIEFEDGEVKTFRDDLGKALQHKVDQGIPINAEIVHACKESLEYIPRGPNLDNLPKRNIQNMRAFPE